MASVDRSPLCCRAFLDGFEFLAKKCEIVLWGMGVWFVVVWIGLPGLHLSSNGFRIIP